jgi:uncharacterized protein (TIGR02466 family)
LSLRALFATQIYTAQWRDARARSLNSRLLRECLQLQADDKAGRAWSRRGYPGGYTSYNSLCRMQQISPTFAALAKRIDAHVRKYCLQLELDLAGRALTMTDCWVNIMPRGVVHSLHLHPHSTISGTYYVQTPPGSSGLKLEDPRLDRYMAAPPRRADARPEHQSWITVPAAARQLVLFESWLRHEVPPNPSVRERISISFNYNWF